MIGSHARLPLEAPELHAPPPLRERRSGFAPRRGPGRRPGGDACSPGRSTSWPTAPAPRPVSATCSTCSRGRSARAMPRSSPTARPAGSPSASRRMRTRRRPSPSGRGSTGPRPRSAAERAAAVGRPDRGRDRDPSRPCPATPRRPELRPGRGPDVGTRDARLLVRGAGQGRRGRRPTAPDPRPARRRRARPRHRPARRRAGAGRAAGAGSRARDVRLHRGARVAHAVDRSRRLPGPHPRGLGRRSGRPARVHGTRSRDRDHHRGPRRRPARTVAPGVGHDGHRSSVLLPVRRAHPRRRRPGPDRDGSRASPSGPPCRPGCGRRPATGVGSNRSSPTSPPTASSSLRPAPRWSSPGWFDGSVGLVAVRDEGQRHQRRRPRSDLRALLPDGRPRPDHRHRSRPADRPRPRPGDGRRPRRRQRAGGGLHVPAGPARTRRRSPRTSSPRPSPGSSSPRSSPSRNAPSCTPCAAAPERSRRGRRGPGTTELSTNPRRSVAVRG